MPTDELTDPLVLAGSSRVGLAPQRLRCGFATGRLGWWQVTRLRAKYAVMRLQGLVYPDVFCIPEWLGSRCRFLIDGDSVRSNDYDLLFAELNADPRQLRYLLYLIETCPGKVVIIPGPREIFAANAGDEAHELAANALGAARMVWAYSHAVADWSDDLAGKRVAQVLPWPFDYQATVNAAGARRGAASLEKRILIGAPLRFISDSENSPEYLGHAIKQAVAMVPARSRMKLRLSAVLYTEGDKRIWERSGYGRRFEAVCEPRRHYREFLGFLRSCDAAINLSRTGVLGRISFLVGALGIPGVFTDNVELSKALYPTSLVHTPCDERLSTVLAELFDSILAGQVARRFLPDTDAARRIGDFACNAQYVRMRLGI